MLASTLDLIEETLKIMASQKLKTAAVAGAVVILTAGTIWLGIKAVHSVRVGPLSQHTGRVGRDVGGGRRQMASGVEGGQDQRCLARHDGQH